MRFILRNSVLLLLLLWSTSVFSQEKSEVIQQRIELISEQLESENVDILYLVEVLSILYDNPLNLNSATKESLQEMGLLTDIQINNLLLHRRMFGKFISIYELQALEYWDMSTIELILPFVKVDDKLDQLHVGLKEAIQQGKFEAYFRYQTNIEDKAGYADVPDSILSTSNSYYHGNKDRYYSRLRFSYRTNLSVGITAEKDPGEAFFRDANKNGFDFYSAHAFYKGGKYVKSVALGDYQVQIGQGLNFWSGYAFAKTADVTNVKKSANSIKPYTSVDETRFLRGAATELGYKNFSLVAFGSVKQVDGTENLDSLSAEEAIISSINLSGLHRTNSEIARKNSLQERIIGGNLKFETRGLQVGLAAVYQGYDKPFIRDTVAYNKYDFRGKETMGISGDYSWVYRNFNFFGELSMSTHSGGLAGIQGILFSIDRYASMSLVYRNYSKEYQTFYNAGFGETRSTRNERGLYAGLSANLSRSFKVNTYLDVFRFPWLKYQIDGPSDGHEFMIQPTYRPNRRLEVYARFREQRKERNSRWSDGTVTPLEDVLQRNYRINLSYQVSESFQIKSRIEYVTVDRESVGPESGMIFTQDVLFKPKSFPLDFSLRYALFDTDSYDTRIYSYENNALYVFSVPSYYYQGSRAYALIRYTFFRKFDLWVRYGVSIFANRKSIGSGPEAIDGNTKSDLTVQLRIKL